MKQIIMLSYIVCISATSALQCLNLHQLCNKEHNLDVPDVISTLCRSSSSLRILSYKSSNSMPYKSCFSLCTHTHTHSTILWPSQILSGTTRVSQHQKGKTNLHLVQQEIVHGSGISWAKKINKCVTEIYTAFGKLLFTNKIHT